MAKIDIEYTIEYGKPYKPISEQLKKYGIYFENDDDRDFVDLIGESYNNLFVKNFITFEEGNKISERIGKTIKDFDEHKIDNTIGEK